MKPKLELIPYGLGGSIHSFMYENSHFSAPWHYHHEMELTYIVKSNGIRHIGSSIDNFTSNDLVLIGKNVPHCWKNDKCYIDGVQSACVQWNEAVFESLISTNIELKSIQKLVALSRSGIKFTDYEFASQIGLRLEEMIRDEPAKKMLTLLNILLDLSQNMDRKILSAEGERQELSGKSDQRIKSILDFIDENFHQKISLKELADVTFMTEVSFCKYFKKQFNRSFTNYLNEFRIRKVCVLLQNTNEKLLAIAMKCGYENMSFFHRQFKKYVDMTPQEYRKKVYF